jgi:RHS repeat-associated protein
LPELSPDNRIAKDTLYLYRYDASGNLIEKSTHVPAGAIRSGNEKTHHYSYDRQHRLVHYRLTHGFGNQEITRSRYLYDAMGRRGGSMVWQCPRLMTNTLYEEYGTMPHQPEVTWYGWDGDRLVTTQTQAVRIQTVYLPGSFTPLLRIETETAALAKTLRKSLAEKLQQDSGIAFPAELVTLLNGLETELKRGVISERNQQWLNQCGLNPEQLKGLVEPECEPERKIHLYHCDHRGLPLALINREGNAVWRAEYDEWGNQQMEDNPENLQQLIRLPGQQYDQETGLYYNRYRYYDAMQRRYITQDPIGLEGGWNPYAYPLNPVTDTDPLGLEALLGPFPLPLPLPKSPAQQEADANAAKALTKWWKNFGDTINNPPPPGNCSNGYYEHLKNQKEAVCNQKRKCYPTDSCETILQKGVYGLACVSARNNIMNQCFNGGDLRHQLERETARGTMVSCSTLAVIKGCL